MGGRQGIGCGVLQSLSQKQYLKKVLQQFGMTKQTKPVSTPLASHFKLSTQLSPSIDVEREYML